MRHISYSYLIVWEIVNMTTLSSELTCFSWPTKRNNFLYSTLNISVASPNWWIVASVRSLNHSHYFITCQWIIIAEYYTDKIISVLFAYDTSVLYGLWKRCTVVFLVDRLHFRFQSKQKQKNTIGASCTIIRNTNITIAFISDFKTKHKKHGWRELNVKVETLI
jgi:hypothetical protein